MFKISFHIINYLLFIVYILQDILFYGFCFCTTVYIKKTLLTKDFVYFIYFYQLQNMLAIFFSASEYAYNMLRFFRNFSLNMLIVVMLIKKRCIFELISKFNELVKVKISIFFLSMCLSISRVYRVLGRSAFIISQSKTFLFSSVAVIRGF